MRNDVKCSRHGLTIGSKTVPLVKTIKFILYPVAKPLALCLDFALGDELATTYSNAEMTKLLQIHVQHNVIDQETAGAMTGALTYKVRTSVAVSFVTNGFSNKVASSKEYCCEGCHDTHRSHIHAQCR